MFPQLSSSSTWRKNNPRSTDSKLCSSRMEPNSQYVPTKYSPGREQIIGFHVLTQMGDLIGCLQDSPIGNLLRLILSSLLCRILSSVICSGSFRPCDLQAKPPSVKVSSDLALSPQSGMSYPWSLGSVFSFILVLLLRRVSFAAIQTSCQFSASEVSVKPKTKAERLKEMFPALCRANDPAPDVCAQTILPHVSLCRFTSLTQMSFNLRN